MACGRLAPMGAAQDWGAPPVLDVFSIPELILEVASWLPDKRSVALLTRTNRPCRRSLLLDLVRHIKIGSAEASRSFLSLLTENEGLVAQCSSFAISDHSDGRVSTIDHIALSSTTMAKSYMLSGSPGCCPSASRTSARRRGPDFETTFLTRRWRPACFLLRERWCRRCHP